MLAAVSIIASIVIAEKSSGEARAINMAGSLRMQTYAAGVAIEQPGNPADRVLAIDAELADFEARYASKALRQVISVSSDNSKRGAYEAIGEYWNMQFKPLARDAAAGSADTGPLRSSMRELVTRIDHLVVLIEQSLESKLQLLRLVQGTSLITLLLLGSLTVYHLREKVLLPLRDLLHCARTVRRGDFSVQVEQREADELGQLGEAFNFMVQDLSQIYASLETRVVEKTDELARSNRSLELLYGTTRTLSERATTREALLQVLAEVERIAGARSGAILLCAEESGPATVLAADMDDDLVEQLCQLARCSRAHGTAVDQTQSLPGPDRSMQAVCVPLSDGTTDHGVMALLLTQESGLPDWQLQLVEAVGRHIGTALAAARRNEERHRLALLDERSVIARELHDSLAQSLSFLNIQVVRLQKMLPQDAPLDPVREVVGDLKEGLNEAYRQLRELLTTFRLRIDGRGLNVAIDQTVQEFTRRAGLTIELANRLLDFHLASNQEIHVLQVIREALSNIEHHARAHHVSISLARLDGDRILVRIDDDGIGIDQGRSHSQRYGIVIMNDRAHSLNGELTVTPRTGGGTRVELAFPARPVAHLTTSGAQENPA